MRVVWVLPRDADRQYFEIRSNFDIQSNITLNIKVMGCRGGQVVRRSRIRASDSGFDVWYSLPKR